MKKRTKETIKYHVLSIIRLVAFISVFMGSFLLIGLASMVLINHILAVYPHIIFSLMDSIFIIVTIFLIPIYIAIKIMNLIPKQKNPSR